MRIIVTKTETNPTNNIIQISEVSSRRRVPDPDTNGKEESNHATVPLSNSRSKNEIDDRSSQDAGYPASTANFKAEMKINKYNDMYSQFEEGLRKKGLIIKRMADDGNCLFRSIAEQVYGDPEMHDQVRERCIQYMIQERDHFSQFITEDFDDYIKRKRHDRCYGNNPEIQAAGEIYNRPIEIYAYDPTNETQSFPSQPINIFHGQYNTDDPPIRLSYHNGNHYNAIIDINHPSVGVGLGLPKLELGLPDRLQMQEAIIQSETTQLDDLMLKQYTQDSELETTEQALQQALLDQSFAEAEAALLAQSRKEYWQQQLNQYKT